MVLCFLLAGCGGGGGGSGAGESGSSEATIAFGPAISSTAGLLPATCTATGSGINLSFVATRLSGVAPLAVFFDASATTGVGTSQPFHELQYSWDFGDGTSGNWGDRTTGASGTGLSPSRNVAFGPIAAHVFEAPGPYTVTLTVSDGVNPPVVSSCAVITVLDPDTEFLATTTCVSATADFTGCPGGATQVTSNDFDATLAAAIAGGSRRILYRGGETFLVQPVAFIVGPGPGLIGSFGGGGAKAIVSPVVNTMVTMINISNNTTPTTDDWRIVDLEIHGTATAGDGPHGFSAQGSASNILMLRLNIHDVDSGIRYGPDVLDAINVTGGALPFAPMWTNILVADSSITNLNGGASSGNNGCICGARRFGFLGNLVDNGLQAEHGFRSNFLQRSVITHNTIQNIRAGKANLTLRTQPFGGTATLPAGTYSEYVVVSDNRLVGGLNDTLGGVGPLNDLQDGRARHYIWERNQLLSSAGATTQAVSFEADQITFRNNVADFTGAPVNARSVIVANTTNPALIPAPPDATDLWIYNNTFVRNDADGDFRGVVIQPGPTNVVVRNNLMWAPAATGRLIHLFPGATAPTTCPPAAPFCNTADTEINTLDPLFVSFPPTLIGDWDLQAGSPVRDRGATLPHFVDLFRAARPAGAYSLGASEQ